MKIAVAQGDGVGMEVIPPAVEILKLLFNNIEFVNVEIGHIRWLNEGTAITEDDIDLIKSCDCMLFGATTSVPEQSVVVRLRKALDLFVNVRPFESLAVSPYKVNFTIVRENQEGLYSGVEEISDDLAVTERIITRAETKRLAAFACNLKDVKKITIVHKANVLRSDIFFRDICVSVIESYNIPYTEMFVDAAAYNLIKHPDRFDHILTSNLFGDILSDEAAALVGSLGACPSANIGVQYAMFEPVHGSAPTIAGKGIANPIGAILSCKMLLEWAGKYDEARLLNNSVKRTVISGITTYDLGGTSTTKEVSDTIIKNLGLN
ncbi:MAG TPA: isocitrate/isopropylmalate family dehydrogenase [Candidatus Acidoferrum sp.]|nr:isocitrate/isopropylmalate family dehydrogenase [Candidatus Acidoferrum sp.]